MGVLHGRSVAVRHGGGLKFGHSGYRVGPQSRSYNNQKSPPKILIKIQHFYQIIIKDYINHFIYYKNINSVYKKVKICYN